VGRRGRVVWGSGVGGGCVGKAAVAPLGGMTAVGRAPLLVPLLCLLVSGVGLVRSRGPQG